MADFQTTGGFPSEDILAQIEAEHQARSYELARVLSAAVFVPAPAPRRSWWRRLLRKDR